MNYENVRRYHFICHGRVQGVGFRYRASRAARALELTGYVRNLYDGTVELELQGDAYQMSRFWPILLERSYIDIDRKETTEMEVNTHEIGFSVRDYYD